MVHGQRFKKNALFKQFLFSKVIKRKDNFKLESVKISRSGSRQRPSRASCCVTWLPRDHECSAGVLSSTHRGAYFS